MKSLVNVRILVLCIALLAALASGAGIFSSQGPGPFAHTSIRGQAIPIWGRGIYQHMSAEVAPQGIAQDWVTLVLGIPLLLVALQLAARGSLRGRFLLAGTLGYFLVTYLFYTVMGMYNALFLVYAALLGCSFFAFALVMLSFTRASLPLQFGPAAPLRLAGGFLVGIAASIALLWLSIVVPPLLDGSIVPLQAEHYTTLVVQGLDLGLLLPLAIVAGLLLLRKKPMGYLLGPVYLVFLALLMTALTAKVVAMAWLGYPVIPVIFIIPSFWLLTLLLSYRLLKNIDLPRQAADAPTLSPGKTLAAGSSLP
ncbi:hypothetical protein [Cesiribacter andamanensis]|uniref:Uncharacterized protein n=1 Tax=Cesiribacter andamanensis AMV16 TaxID=1279009 RepID=M7NWC6_9BACT|nr:hypothetical protein [Cesiribacter andamanensis]EMR02744.1 hypothetical protein ADICEAN_02113 [Cesiribacter andamanensis AMV16]